MKKRLFMPGLVAAIAVSAATKRTFKVEQFNAVDFSGTATYIYTVAEKCSVHAEGEARDIDHYQVRVKGERLHITLKPGHRKNVGKVVFRIAAPTLKTIQQSGASKFYAKKVQTSADFDLDVSGASAIDILKLEVKGRLDIDMSGASKTLLPVTQCRQLALDVSGASKLQTAISAEGNADVDVSGASKVAAIIHTAGNVDMNFSGASKLELNVEADKVSVHNSGASKTRIKLDCKQLRAHNSGATKLVLEGTADKVELDQSGASKYDTSDLNRF